MQKRFAGEMYLKRKMLIFSAWFATHSNYKKLSKERRLGKLELYAAAAIKICANTLSIMSLPASHYGPDQLIMFCDKEI
jgi:hypothetical protein